MRTCVRACVRMRSRLTTTHAPNPARCFLSDSGQSVEKNRERMWLVVPLLLLFAVCTCRADDEIETNEIDGRVSAAPRKAQHVRDITLAEIFENAVQAYLEENWDSCITGFNDALHGYVIIIRLLIYSFL